MKNMRGVCQICHRTVASGDPERREYEFPLHEPARSQAIRTYGGIQPVAHAPCIMRARRAPAIAAMRRYMLNCHETGAAQVLDRLTDAVCGNLDDLVAVMSELLYDRREGAAVMHPVRDEVGELLFAAIPHAPNARIIARLNSKTWDEATPRTWCLMPFV
jgi:hypothetical protein